MAPTGIGKTEAAMLPIFHKLISTEGKGIRVYLRDAPAGIQP